MPQGDEASANFSFKLGFWGLPGLCSGRVGGTAGTGAAGGRARGAGSGERGAVRSAAAQGGAGARGRQAGPGLLERPVWSPGTRGGGPGIPSRTVRPGSCQTWLGLARAAWPPPRAALRSGSKQATYRAAQRKWLEFLPRRLARASGRAGRGGRPRDRAQALRGAGQGCRVSEPRAPAGPSPLGALSPIHCQPLGFNAGSPAQPADRLTCF